MMTSAIDATRNWDMRCNNRPIRSPSFRTGMTTQVVVLATTREVDTIGGDFVLIGHVARDAGKHDNAQGEQAVADTVSQGEGTHPGSRTDERPTTAIAPAVMSGWATLIGSRETAAAYSRNAAP